MGIQQQFFRKKKSSEGAKLEVKTSYNVSMASR
jgi:hypothetical protein